MKQYYFPFDQGKITLIDSEGIVDHICILARQEPTQEHCVLALAQRKSDCVYELIDSCSIGEMGGSTTENYAMIPKKVSLALIRLCARQELVPVIIHTHTPSICPAEPVIFSKKDQLFMEQFSKVAIAQSLRDPCIFLVTNGQSLLICETGSMSKQYFQKEKLCYAKAKLGFPADCP